VLGSGFLHPSRIADGSVHVKLINFFHDFSRFRWYGKLRSLYGNPCAKKESQQGNADQKSGLPYAHSGYLPSAFLTTSLRRFRQCCKLVLTLAR